MMDNEESTLTTSVVAALARARDHLLSLQNQSGWWKGELETNVTMDAEDMLLRKFLGVLTDDIMQPSAAWIRSQQRVDGTWANFFNGPGNLSTTVEAYVALRLAGDSVDAEHMLRAREFILDSGGVACTRVFTRFWLALFSVCSWDDLPAMPPELIFFPAWFPFNIYDWACWARQTIVPLTVVAAHRPQRDLGFTVDELRTGGCSQAADSQSAWARRFTRMDQALRAYERHPNRFLRLAALQRATEWILRRQEADGSWGGIQPPWVYSMLALNVMGYSVNHPVLKAAFAGLERFTIRQDGVRRFEACQSPVWDTALAMIALSDAGLAGDHPALQRAADFLLGQEIAVKGDWAVRRPNLRPGGWAFEFENDNYPDIDDTAEVIMALRRVEHRQPERLEAAIRRGLDWLWGMQSRNGGWASFDADNGRELIKELPFSDFGAVVDPPSVDVTAHVVEMLAGENLIGEPKARHALEFLRRGQEPDGSWFGRWGANFIYGTGAVIPAAVAAGVSPADPAIRTAVRWLEAHQNGDGGWGEDLRSYDDPASWSGRGESTASQTSWALLALLAAREQQSSATARGIRFLCRTQTADGTWREPLYTATGFPGDFYINYHLYRHVCPLQALGRYLNGPHAHWGRAGGSKGTSARGM